MTGYTGHIPGIVAENLFSKSYGKTSAKALKGTHGKGADVPPPKRYKSMATKEFGEKNFRRIGRHGLTQPITPKSSLERITRRSTGH